MVLAVFLLQAAKRVTKPGNKTGTRNAVARRQLNAGMTATVVAQPPALYATAVFGVCMECAIKRSTMKHVFFLLFITCNLVTFFKDAY
jgi:hypothetical protein